MEQDGFGLVVGGVADQDRLGADLGNHGCKRLVADDASRVLEGERAVRLTIGGGVDAADQGRDAERLGALGDGGRFGGRFGAQGVVDVGGDQVRSVPQA